MGRDTIQLKNAVSTISQEYLLEFTSEYGIPEDLHPELPGPEDTIVDFLEGKVGIYTSDRRSQNMDFPQPNRVIDIEDPTMASGFSGTPSTIERSPLDLDNENPAPTATEGTGAGVQAQDVLAPGAPPKEATATTEVIQEAMREEEVVAMEPPANKRRKQMHHKRVNEVVEVNAPPKVLRKDHVSSLAHSIHGGKSLAAMGLDAGSTFSTPDAQDDSTTAKSVSDLDPLSYSKPQPFPEQDITQSSNGTATEIPPPP
ncbi:hypothetical protein Tco_0109359 [Tanacetum coccineum]